MDRPDAPFPAGFFERVDEGSDEEFYGPPRLVAHIDDDAIAAVGGLYEHLGISGHVLDLMSSWISHFRTAPASLTALGMNAAELSRNPMATGTVVHDLNVDPCLPFADGSFDDATCCVSVDYLVRPVEVFAEVARVLRPGGRFVVSFSNRCFPTKAIKGWLANGDMGRLAIVRAYFERSGTFAQPELAHCNPGAPGDPLYAAWAAADVTELDRLEADVVHCRSCARLVEWRERVAVERRAAFRDETYWGRPVPGFGDPAARIVVVGLAPAAHGANRTGRVFTGDRSGDFLFAAMHAVGLANQPTSTHAGDGLELHGVWVTAPVKCAPPANAPTPAERDACAPYLRRELAALRPEVVVALGTFGFDAASRAYGLRPRPRFGHGVEVAVAGGPTLLGSFHPSQQNTFTRRLTPPMLEAVLRRAATLARGSAVSLRRRTGPP